MPDSLVDAWCRGLVAGRDEQPANANPYEIGSQLAENWDDGWREGVHPRNRSAGSDDDRPEDRLEDWPEDWPEARPTVH